MDYCLLGFIGSLGPPELLIVGIIALLLFGKKLPEVARSLGKGVTEFKKGISGIEDEIRSATNTSSYSNSSYSKPSRPIPAEERETATAPKFEPPAFSPQEQAAKDESATDSTKEADA